MPITVRVFFSKCDRASYISHLDITRVFSRAIARAGLPVWYTEGFSPRVYMTFPLPLSLGYQSRCESMDIRLIDESYPLSQVVTALNATLPVGITILDAALPEQPPAAIALADYQLAITCNDPPQLAQQLEELLAQPAIMVVKKTKKGDREIDIKPYCTLLECEVDAELLKATLRLPAGSELNISPSLLLEALFARIGQAPYCRVQRLAIYTASGSPWR